MKNTTSQIAIALAKNGIPFSHRDGEIVIRAENAPEFDAKKLISLLESAIQPKWLKLSQGTGTRSKFFSVFFDSNTKLLTRAVFQKQKQNEEVVKRIDLQIRLDRTPIEIQIGGEVSEGSVSSRPVGHKFIEIRHSGGYFNEQEVFKKIQEQAYDIYRLLKKKDQPF